MNPLVSERNDQVRGCGWRKEGGLYLISKGQGMPCCKMPILLHSCPTCGAGIKPARGWTWINSDHLFPATPCADISAADRELIAAGHGDVPEPACPAARKMGRIGLLWVGEAFYKTPRDFINEAAKQGISRRINALPKGFECGKTWIAFAHRKGLSAPCPVCTTTENVAKLIAGLDPCDSCDGSGMIEFPTIFYLFQPEAIEYVTKGDEDEDFLESLEKRGITPIKVVRVEEENLFTPKPPTNETE